MRQILQPRISRPNKKGRQRIRQYVSPRQNMRKLILSYSFILIFDQQEKHDVM